MLADPDIRDLVNEIYDVLAVGVDTSTGEDTSSDLSAGLHESTYRFSGFKTYHEMNEVSHLLQDEAGNIRPFNDFMRDVRGIDKQYNENYLKSEYLLVSQSAAMAAKWEEIEADGDRYDLQYRTAGDENVRAEHAALDGVTLPSSDPFWESYYPPNGYRCRCTAVQVRKGKYPRSDSVQAIAKGDEMTTGKLSIFRFNPGKTRSAMPPKHPYMPTGCGDCDFQVQLSHDPNRDKCKACSCIAKQITNNPGVYGRERVYVSENGRVVTTFVAEKEASDYEVRLQVAKYFADVENKDVVIAPRVHFKNPLYNKIYGALKDTRYEHKCPDLIINGYYYEIEGFTTNNQKTAIRNMLSHGLKQSSRLIIKECGVTDNYLMDRIKGKINEGIPIDKVWVIGETEIRRVY